MAVVKDIEFTSEQYGEEKFCLDLYLPDHVECSSDKLSNKRLEQDFTKYDKVNGYDQDKRASDYTTEQISVTKRKFKLNENDNQWKNHDSSVKVEQGNETKRYFRRKQNVELKSDWTKTRRSERPTRPTDRSGTPFVVFIHGGGWRRGARGAWKHYLFYDVNFLVSFLQFIVGTYGNIGETFAANGVACAVISYPLTEASIPVLLFEMFLSYIQCCFFVLVSCLPLMATGVFFRSFLTSPSSCSTTWELIFPEQRETGLLKLFLLSIMLLTNIATLGIILIKRKQFKVGKSSAAVTSVLFLPLVFLVTNYQYVDFRELLTFLTCVTFLFNQTLILRLRSLRQNRMYDDQLNVVKSAVHWTQKFCQGTGIADSTQIYLMGHSAGGHLATLVALEQRHTDKDSNIKGVISLSGVYDILCLNGRLLKYAYLFPTFGDNFDTWLTASPAHVVKRIDNGVLRAKFLLMSAERDLFLKQQSLDFYDALKTKGVNCDHVEIRRTNHFTIVTNTRTDVGSPMGYALEFIKN